MAEKFNQFKSIDRSAQREQLNWQTRALCAQTDPDLFFPDAKGNMDAAKKVCAKCEEKKASPAKFCNLFLTFLKK